MIELFVIIVFPVSCLEIFIYLKSPLKETETSGLWRSWRSIGMTEVKLFGNICESWSQHGWDFHMWITQVVFICMNKLTTPETKWVHTVLPQCGCLSQEISVTFFSGTANQSFLKFVIWLFWMTHLQIHWLSTSCL